MPSYQYNGDHQRITIEGITFISGQATELTADQDKLLKASGFGKAIINNGELVEVEAAPAKAKAETTTTKTTNAKADAKSPATAE